MKNLRSRWVLLTGLVLPLLIGGSCAYKRMIFKNLDWLVVFQLDSYLDLNSEQKKQINPPVEETVAWLKSERLPAIKILLTDVLTAVKARKIEVTTFKSWLQRTAVWRSEVTHRLAPPLSQLFKQLDDDQLKHLEKKLQKSDKTLVQLLERSESEFPEELEDYGEEIADSYTFWFGKLRKDQKQLLKEKLGWNRALLNEQLKQKRRVREFWLSLMRKREAESLVTAIRNSAQPDGAWNDPEYLSFRKANAERNAIFLEALFASLDQQQWQYFEKVIQDLVADFESLMEVERKSH